MYAFTEKVIYLGYPVLLDLNKHIHSICLVRDDTY